MYCEEDKKKGAGGEAAGIYNYHPLKNKKEYLSNLMLEGETWHERTTSDEQLLHIYMH